MQNNTKTYVVLLNNNTNISNFILDHYDQK